LLRAFAEAEDGGVGVKGDAGRVGGGGVGLVESKFLDEVAVGTTDGDSERSGPEGDAEFADADFFGAGEVANAEFLLAGEVNEHQGRQAVGFGLREEFETERAVADLAEDELDLGARKAERGGWGGERKGAGEKEKR
jgi:hypothetical protein